MRISDQKVLQLAMESIALRSDLPEATRQAAIAQLHKINPRARYDSPFGFQTKEDWLDCFRTQFQKHREEIRSARQYNIVKDADTPTWGTICNHTGVSTWTALMQLAGVKYDKRRETVHTFTEFTATHPLLEQLKQINATREAQLNRLEELLRRHPVEPLPPQSDSAQSLRESGKLSPANSVPAQSLQDSGASAEAQPGAQPPLHSDPHTLPPSALSPVRCRQK